MREGAGEEEGCGVIVGGGGAVALQGIVSYPTKSAGSMEWYGHGRAGEGVRLGFGKAVARLGRVEL